MNTNKKILLFMIVLIFALISITACDSGSQVVNNPETYNASVIIEGVVNADHAEFFSITADGDPGIDQFSYESNSLTGNITGLSGTIELTIIIDDENLEDGEYKFVNENENVLEVDSNNNEAKFTVEFIGEGSKIAEIDINNDVQNISVAYGTSEDDVKSQLANKITIKDTNDNEFIVNLDWTIEDYDSNAACDYTATGIFMLPEGVDQTDPATELEVNAIVTVQIEEVELIDSIELVLVEAGTTSSDNGSVTLDYDFYIGKYHVTQADFKDIMGFNPSYFNDNDHSNLTGNSDNRPVEQISWYDAIEYANALSDLEGLDKYYIINGTTVTENKGANGYRLPTEDEHEYAARGGKDGYSTTYAGSDNLDEVGWYINNSDEANSGRNDNRGTMPVGEKEANELGLFDMTGNVSDWTNTSSNSSRIFRRGSFNNLENECKVSESFSYSPESYTIGLGFRLARSPEYNLNIEIEGEGRVEIDSDNNKYTAGTEITLEAIPDSGWDFSHWDGDVADSNSAETTLIINEDKTVTAYFEEVEITTLLDEDFNDKFPEGWEIIVGGTTDDTWTRVEPNSSDNSLDGTPFMIANSDALGSGFTMDEKLITPEINIPNPPGKLMLSFEHYYRHMVNSIGNVQVYDGTEWVVVKTFDYTAGSWIAPAEKVIDITGHANDKLRVSFHYTDGGSWAWYWVIDNVKIEVVE